MLTLNLKGYLADLAIPSAGLNLTVSGIVEEGSNQMLIRGDFKGVTLKKLASLADISGTNDLTAHLPSQIKKVGDKLGTLQLESIGVTLSTSVTGFGLTGAFFTIGMPDLDWKIINDFKIDSIAMDFGIISPFSKPSLFTSIRGSIDIMNIPFKVGASTLDGYTAYIETADKQTIKLKDFISKHAGNLPTPGNLTVNQFQVMIAPAKAYSFSLALASQPKPWVIPLGITDLTISNVSMGINKVSGKDATGSFSGTTSIGNSASFLVNYVVPGAFTVTGNFPQFKLTDLISIFTDAKYSKPAGFDFTVGPSSMLIQKQDSNFILALAAEIDDLGAVGFELVRSSGDTSDNSGNKGNNPNGKEQAGKLTVQSKTANDDSADGQSSSGWGFAFGVDLNIGAIADITGLSSLKIFDDTLTFNQQDEFMMIFSSVKDPNFLFNSFSSFSDPNLPSGATLQLPSKSRGSFDAGLSEGLFIYT